MHPFSQDGPVIDCRHLAKTYAQGQIHVEVLTDVNLQVLAGEKIAIIGVSGSGKSTLLHLLGGLDSPSAGEIRIVGEDMARLNDADRGRLRNRALGFVYQFHHLLPEFTALENVSMPLAVRNLAPARVAERARALLERVGLTGRLHHKPAELSGGERQRVAIARALISEPNAILADELTGNLDRKTADHVFELMLRLNREMRTALLIATHDPYLAARMDVIYALEDGVLVRQ
jgi:lipoprotein-releasing system ATP-binding protein